MFFPIIIVQTSDSGFMMAQRAIEELGLADQTCLLDGIYANRIRSLLDPTQRQLFITGTIHGEAQPVIDFVTELRKVQPNLTCLSYAVGGTFSNPPFHGEIDKCGLNGPVKALKEAILKFQSTPA